MHSFKLFSKRFFVATSLHTALGAFLLGCSALLYAADDNQDIEVTEQGGIYRIKASVEIDAPAEYVRQVVSDFVHIYRLNPSIIESEVLAGEDDAATYVRTRILGCAGYFCQELERVEKMQTLPSGDLLAEVVPEKSDFKSGRTLWHIEAVQDRSRIIYESEMEPDFYIPPVVGKFIAKNSIRAEITTGFQNLERIANVLAERVWNADFRISSLKSALAARELAAK